MVKSTIPLLNKKEARAAANKKKKAKIIKAKPTSINQQFKIIRQLLKLGRPLDAADLKVYDRLLDSGNFIIILPII
jgi:hypothetical protein